MKKKPASAPELPPGRACLPGSESTRSDMLHGSRWLEVSRLMRMSRTAFLTEFGTNKTWLHAYDIVAENESMATGKAVSGSAIKASYEIVARAIRKGEGHRFVPDWPAIILG
jgi:hypothetical protein